MRNFLPVLLSVACMLAGTANALTITSNPSTPIPDNQGPGNPVLDVISTNGLFGAGAVITNLFVTVQIDHTWVGDLAIELIHEDGTTLQLVARPGDTHPNETTGGPFGDATNLSALEPIRFIDTALTSAELLGAAQNGGTVPAGDYFPDADGWDSDLLTFAEFNGFLAEGLWSLRVGDYAAADTGTFQSWTLDIEAIVIIPEPSPALLLGLGLVAIASTRRRALRSSQR